jgi:RNA recognition motif-containing protein
MSSNIIEIPRLQSRSVSSDWNLTEADKELFIQVREETKMQTDEIREQVYKSIPYRLNFTAAIAKKSLPTNNGRYNKRFNNVSDLSQWLKTRTLNQQKFNDWIALPLDKARPLYSPNGSYLKISDDSLKFKSILIRNIDPKTTPIELREIFSQYGFIRDVYIPFNYCTKEKANYAFIEMCFNIESYSTMLDEFNHFNILHKSYLKIQEATAGRKSSCEMKKRGYRID